LKTLFDGVNRITVSKSPGRPAQELPAGIPASCYKSVSNGDRQEIRR